MIRQLLIVCLLIGSFLSRSQTFPVQSFLQITPPHSSYLPDYSDPFNEQMKVLLTLTDFTVPSYDVKLQFIFNGNGYSMETPAYAASPTFTLSPGVPLEISGSDLAYFLDINNLQVNGLNTQDYLTRKVLPEGPLTVCVKVLDANLAIPTNLANQACNQIWVSLQEPPLLNMPMCGTEVPPTNPQFLNYSWMPLHMITPGAMSNTEYLFELWEIRPDGNDPNIVVSQSLPIYSTITNQTLLSYGITEPPLQIGMSYVWRVTAIDITGRDHFRHQGKSQVCWFTYGDMVSNALNGITLSLQTTPTGNRQGKAFWATNNVFEDYELEVRKTGNPNYAWFPHSTVNGSYTVNSLEPETEYEARVRGLAQGQSSDWSNVSTFTTHPTPDYACGVTTMPPLDPNAQPLQTAQPYMTVNVGQFEMMLTAIQPSQVQNGPGWFQGTGKITIPFALMSMNVHFDAIFIDENLKVVTGEIQAVTDGMDAWLNEQALNNAQHDTVDGTITDAGTFGDSLAWVVVDGDTLTFEFPDPFTPVVIHDDSDFIYIIYPDGTVEIQADFNTSGDALAATDRWRVDFEAHPNQIYGFDPYLYKEWKDKYEHIECTNLVYHVPWKSAAKQANDQVKAKFIDLDNVGCGIEFRTQGGNLLSSTNLGNGLYDVTLPAVDITLEIYAECNGERIGKLNFVPYTAKEKDVYLVPLSANYTLDTSSINGEIAAIYNQGVGKINIHLMPAFTDNTWDGNTDNLLEAGSHGALSDYSSEMKALNQAYINANPNLNSKDYLIFIIPGFDESNVDVGGYMPIGRHKGYVVNQGSAGATAHVLAHEIGHGCYGLKHSFPEVAQSSTANLMDYGNAHHLTKMQWDEMKKDLLDFSLFDDDADGEYIVISSDEIPQEFKNSDTTMTFMSLSGKLVTIPANASRITFSGVENELLKDNFTFWGEETTGIIYSAVNVLGALRSFELTTETYGFGGNSDFDYNFTISQNQELFSFEVTTDYHLDNAEMDQFGGYEVPISSLEAMVVSADKIDGAAITEQQRSELLNGEESPSMYIDSLSTVEKPKHFILGIPSYVDGEIEIQLYKMDVAECRKLLSTIQTDFTSPINDYTGSVVANSLIESLIFKPQKNEEGLYTSAALINDKTVLDGPRVIKTEISEGSLTAQENEFLSHLFGSTIQGSEVFLAMKSLNYIRSSGIENCFNESIESAKFGYSFFYALKKLEEEGITFADVFNDEVDAQQEYMDQKSEDL